MNPKKRSRIHLLLVALGLLVVGGVARAEEDAAAKAYLAGDLDRTSKLLESEIAKGSARASRYLLLSRVYFQQEKWEKAQSTLDKLLKKDSEDPQARELMGRVLYRLRKFADALTYLEEAVQQTGRAELRLELAEALIELNRSTDALKNLKEVVGGNQAWPRAHYLLGKLRLQNGQGHWASQQLWTALELGYKEKDLRLLLAAAFYQEGRITGPLVLTALSKGVEIGSRTDDYIVVSKAVPGPEEFWYVARPDSAIYQIEAALSEDKAASEEAGLLAARCWLTVGNVEKAARYSANIKKNLKEAFTIHVEIALAKEDLDGFRKLVAEAQPASRPEPEDMVRYLLQATLVAQVQGDLNSALAFLQEADRLLPGRSEVLRPMVNVLEGLNRNDEAKQKMQVLAELHPDSPEIRLLAGRQGVDLESIENAGAPVLKQDETGTPEKAPEEDVKWILDILGQ